MEEMKNESHFQCPPNTFAYTVQPGDNFFTIAKQFDVSLDELVSANPQIEDPAVIHPGETVCVPEFKCPENTFAYTVKPGDTFFTIARQFNVSLDELVSANPQIEDPAVISPGQIVCVPVFECPPNTFAYTVQPGDTFFTIAKQFDVSLDELVAANLQIKDPAVIFPGQTVCVPEEEPPPPPEVCPEGTFVYTVKPGDSLWAIARRFNISLDDLIAANPQIKDPAVIFPGQKICVPEFECPENTFAYTVKSGDTMFFIAKKFNVSLQELIDANPQILDPNRIDVGQIVCVPN